MEMIVLGIMSNHSCLQYVKNDTAWHGWQYASRPRLGRRRARASYPSPASQYTLPVPLPPQ